MNSTNEKEGLHPRNRHRFLYEFPTLVRTLPALKEFVFRNNYGNESIDFANPEAVKLLNKALLSYHYEIKQWDIPAKYLCPAIPGRAEYIHQMADVLGASNNGLVPKGSGVKVLDVGIGANCIYPIIGNYEYGWNFVGSDIDKIALQSVEKIIAANPSLKEQLECRLQPSNKHIFTNIIRPTDFFDFTLCNPPFHASSDDAIKGTERKLRNLGKQKTSKLTQNFAGQNAELWCEGGEIAFISQMIFESILFKTQCQWFSTLVSKSDNLPKIYALLNKINVLEVKTIPMKFGNKSSRIVAWTFQTKLEQEKWMLKNAKDF